MTSEKHQFWKGHDRQSAQQVQRYRGGTVLGLWRNRWKAIMSLENQNVQWGQSGKGGAEMEEEGSNCIGKAL
jgi:hypothetical protein